jgi:predicted Rossmann fold nucleotide-binding protein DprA/Smf involved in DNA uptake
MTKIHGERRILAEQILQNGGAIISELPLETPSYKSMFPARNRIIAGISNAVVIVESKEKGGSMLTANFALQYNRPLFALSGNCFQEHYLVNHEGEFIYNESVEYYENWADENGNELVDPIPTGGFDDFEVFASAKEIY